MVNGLTRLGRKAAVLLSLLSVGPVCAQPAQSEQVRDLYYGEVLYQFYQQNYYSAAVDLLTAQQQHRLQHHTDDAQLLLGGLYLSYGLHSEAEAIFNKLLNDKVAPAVRDQAWFYLGKIRYEKGLYSEADEALARVGDALDPTLQEEFQTLKANLLMARGQYQAAAESLQKMAQGEGESNYARFNLGVALSRAGREAEGMALIARVGELRSNQEDLKALRDKANLALGYLNIKKDPVTAKGYLTRVRLHGPFSDKALLGLGWAEVELQRYEQALVPWQELASRDRVDVAGFESLLAIGNVLERLRAFPQAMAAYQKAIATYELELTTLDGAMAAVKAGRLWDDLLAQVDQNQMGWFWEAELLPDTPEARYLPTLMASHGFHEAIKNLRDLKFLANKLARWDSEMPALDYMLELRRKTYQAQLERLTPEDTLARVADVRASRDIYFQELQQIDEQQDAMALATAKERKLLDRLARVEERIWRLSSQRNVDEYREKYRFYKGLLEYDIRTTFAIRRRQVEKSLKSLDQALAGVLAQQDSLQRARQEAPKRFLGFGARIAEQRVRIAGLQIGVEQAFDEQKAQLQTLVDERLGHLRQQLVDYRDRARFSLAHLQDLAAEQGGGQ
jgi:Flp pilus assembly protein TadD